LGTWHDRAGGGTGYASLYGKIAQRGKHVAHGRAPGGTRLACPSSFGLLSYS